MTFGRGEMDNPEHPEHATAAILVADGLRCLRDIADFTNAVLNRRRRG